MKLHATMKGDRGKAVEKSSNEEIFITFTKDRRQRFDIIFNGDSISILHYYDGSVELINYIPEAKD